jgi:hypothetical protein
MELKKEEIRKRFLKPKIGERFIGETVHLFVINTRPITVEEYYVPYSLPENRYEMPENRVVEQFESPQEFLEKYEKEIVFVDNEARIDHVFFYYVHDPTEKTKDRCFDNLKECMKAFKRSKSPDILAIDARTNTILAQKGKKWTRR